MYSGLSILLVWYRENQCVSMCIKLFSYMGVFVLYLASKMGLHCPTFMGRNLGNKKNWTPIWMTNSAGMNSRNIVNNISIFNESLAMSSIFREKYRDALYIWSHEGDHIQLGHMIRIVDSLHGVDPLNWGCRSERHYVNRVFKVKGNLER